MCSQISIKLSAEINAYCMQKGQQFDETIIRNIANNTLVFDIFKDNDFQLLRPNELIVAPAGAYHDMFDIYVVKLRLFYRVTKEVLLKKLYIIKPEVVIFHAGSFIDDQSINEMKTFIHYHCEIPRLMNEIVLKKMIAAQPDLENKRLMKHLVEKQKTTLELVNFLKPIGMFEFEINKARIEHCLEN